MQLYDIGTVYVYKTNVHSTSTELVLITSNLRRDKISGARFGATVAALGDIDKDRYEDFAVAAPFENEGEGAVYIYR